MNLDKELDKFYTKENVAKTLIGMIDLSLYDLVIEPSAGSGSFSKNIAHHNLISLDIAPEWDGVIQQDWFEYKISDVYEKVLVIGNPPFGKFNTLSKKFLKHAFSFKNVHTVAFVLPNVFRKYTLQKSVPKEFKITNIIELPKSSFTISGSDYHVPCSFFIFSKEGSVDLRQSENFCSDDFEFATKNDYDFFIMGASPKTIKDIPTENNRGYFIKSKIKKNELIKKWGKIKWNGHSSANGGVSWFTKIDIVENYIKNFPNKK